jgi:hypothetical protein
VSYQLGNAKVWDGTQWVLPIGAPDKFGYPSIVQSGSATITSPSVEHAASAWTQVIESTSRETTWLQVRVNGDTSQSGQDTRLLADVGIGPAGSEAIIIESIPLGWSSGIIALRLGYLFPVKVQAGSRIALRTRSLQTNQARSLGVNTFIGSSTSPTSIVTYGADTANSRGTNLALGNTWYPVGTTEVDLQGLVFAPTLASNINVSNGNPDLTLATGLSGSQTIRRTNSFSVQSLGGGTWAQLSIARQAAPYQWYIEHVPAGTELWLRTPNYGRPYFDGIVFGVPYP